MNEESLKERIERKATSPPRGSQPTLAQDSVFSIWTRQSIAGIANQLCKGEDMLSTEANEPEDIVNSKKMNAGKGESVDRK